jgi:hypothetical protein
MNIFLAVLATAAIFSGLLFYQKKQFKQQTGIASNIKKLNEEADSLNDELNNLLDDIDSKSEELKALERNKNALINNEKLINEQTLDLESKQSKIKKEIDALSSKLSVIDIEYKSKNQPYQDFIKQYEKIKSDISEAKMSFDSINSKTMQLQKLEKDAELLKVKEEKLQASVKSLTEQQFQLNELLSKIDLYTRIDEFTSVGHYETPDYLYETSKRYADEIKDIREKQKSLISSKMAVNYPDDISLCKDSSLNRKILDGQINLLLNTFNIECDFLIEKVSPSNFSRTLEQIEKKAEVLEKSCATLKCGFSIDYIKLKFEECKLQYEFKLKKQEEQEEQALIREQMREEARLQKEYEVAIRNAEEDELRFRRLIDKAREELATLNGQEYAITSAKISELETRLQEALDKGARAKSLAEQTRRGFVYVISNLGSFGEDVYKIGLTRRLDPQERVDELGGASVPFTFDIHAVCFSEDAPTLERALHKKFSHKRINAVNFRKEFFKVSLEEIQEAVKELTGSEVDFKFTVKANDYFESRRLLASS